MREAGELPASPPAPSWPPPFAEMPTGEERSPQATRKRRRGTSARQRLGRLGQALVADPVHALAHLAPGHGEAVALSRDPMRSGDTTRRRRSHLRADGRYPGTNLFRKEGEYWTIAYGGVTRRLRDSKGLHCLARLLGRPGERVPAPLLLLDLAEGGGEIIADAERARVAVTKRIKAALRKIQQHHPSLGHHLTTCIKTGRVCAYTPDPEQPVAWVLQ